MADFVRDTFADGVAGNTPITAAKLNNVEQRLVDIDTLYTPLLAVARKYVPSTGVAGTDTAALQAAHDALPAGGGTILLDAGPYVLTADTINFTKAVHLLGNGPSGVSAASGSSFLYTGTLIQCASATGVAVAVNSDGCSFEKLALFNTAGSTPSAGAGIQITTKGKSTRVVDCSFNGFWTNLQFIQGYEWYVSRCHFFDPVKYGIRIQDTDITDACDGIISDSFIYSGPTNLTPTAAIQWESGGGLKVVGTKINKRGSAQFTVGIDFQIADGVSTSVGVVTGCSIESVTYCVLLQQLGPSNTGTFNKVTIGDNEFLGNYAVAVSAGATNKISGVNIAGNAGSGSVAFFLLSNCSGVNIGLNTITSGPALSVGAGVTNLFLDGALAFTTAARPSAAVMRAGSRYYDTTLSKPGWSDGAAWRDAAGTAI